MGSGQSRELCDRVAPERVFVNTNAQEMQKLMLAMHDVAVLAQRGREALSETDSSASSTDNDKGAEAEGKRHSGSEHHSSSNDSSTNVAHEVNSEDAPRPFTEEEQRELFAPYETLCFANHYLTNEIFQRDESAGLIAPTSTTTKKRDAAGGVALSPIHVLDILVRNPFLTSLDLSYNHLQDIALVPFIEHALTPLTQLTHLNLAGNAFGAKGCRAMADHLATDPLLETLVLLQCELNDETLEPIVTDGLRTNRHLRVLNLDFNACGERTVEQLLSTLDINDTLAVVFLEGVPHCPETLQVLPPDRTRRVEYACTAEGYFRSGLTYYDDIDKGEDATTKEEENIEKNEVSAKAQEERFRQRCRVLTHELSGQRPLDPRLMQQLRAKLEPRLAHYQTTLRQPRAEARLRQAMAYTIGAAKNMESDGDESEDSCNGVTSAVVSRPSSHSESRPATSDAPQVDEQAQPVIEGDEMKEEEINREEEEEEETMRQSWASQLPAVLAELFPHTSRLRSRRDRQRALRQAQEQARGYGTSLPHGTRFSTSFTRSCGKRRGHTAPLSESELLYRKRGEACLRLPRVRPNGFDRVVLPPRAQQQQQKLNMNNEASANGPNYILQGPPSRLRPCWCTPTEISAAYAGTLHYHCRREEHIDYTQSLWRPSPLRGGPNTRTGHTAAVSMMNTVGDVKGNASRGQRAGGTTRGQAMMSPRRGSGSLPPINTAAGRPQQGNREMTKGKYFTNTTPGAATRGLAADQIDGGRASGMASPGHPTVRDHNASSTPSLNSNGLLPAMYATQTNSPGAAHNAASGPRSGLMSTMPRTNSGKGRQGNANGTAATATMMMMLSSVPSPLPRRARPAYHGCCGTGHRCVSMSTEAVARAQSMATGAAASATTKHGSTLFVSRDGVAMELHYNPVAYFSAPYQTCAAIRE